MPYDEAAPQLDGDLKGLTAGVRARLARTGVLFRPVSGRSAFPLDPIPRVIAETDWLIVKGALGQRVQALNAFVADAYGDRRIVREGVMPERVIETAGHYEPAMRGVRVPGDLWVGVAGLDLVRDGDGEFRVIEDNLLTPSGFGYVVAARDAILPELDPPADAAPRSFAELPIVLAGAMRAASPVEREPYFVVLTEPDNAARWEHAWAAGALGIPLVEPADLRLDGERVMHGEFAVDVVYRRADADMLDCDVGRLLEPAVRAGTLGVVNAYGCGVGDDKLAHAYVEDMVRFYLDEEPLIRSVPTLDLSRPEHLERALDVFEELVIKPRAGQGGQDVMVGPVAEPDEREAIRKRVRDSPEDWVAQEFVELSTHPTLIDGALAPRHVDLRPFVFMQGPDDARVLAGGLTRFAIEEGAMVVNTSLNGGFKDTWVVP
ncbi:MAG TPA: circularly permuted type 2 ATP-grasp protein [Solirubrobacteraceae bacterium]|nr:circularly permuted type 2 ATP-grasp protein [Solirubrobacteraceae bacterium]